MGIVWNLKGVCSIWGLFNVVSTVIVIKDVSIGKICLAKHLRMLHSSKQVFMGRVTTSLAMTAGEATPPPQV